MTATAYVTATEIKAAAPDAFSGSTHDAILGALATRASELIDGLLGHEPGAFDASATAADRYYSGDGGDYIHIDPCTAVSNVYVKANETAATYDTWTADTDYIAAAGSPDDPAFNAGYYSLLYVPAGSSKVFTRGKKTIKVSAKWGRTDDPPGVIEQAVIIQVVRWFKRGQAAFQDVAGQVQVGTLTYAAKLDPDIETIVLNSGYRRCPR